MNRYFKLRKAENGWIVTLDNGEYDHRLGYVPEASPEWVFATIEDAAAQIKELSKELA